MRALKDTTNSQASTTRKTTSSTSLYQPGVTYTNTANLYDHKTHIKINHGENKVLLVNTLCSCLHMTNYLKEELNINKDDLIDLIDFDGNIKEIPNSNNKEYAIQYVSPTTNYAIIKIENDPITNEKRYNALLSESKLSGNMIKTLTTLNMGKNLTAKEKAKLNREARLKQEKQDKPEKQSTNGQTVNLNSSSNNQISTGNTTSRKAKK